jgi:RNA polymerase sigma-70 factor, ECF subfamily
MNLQKTLNGNAMLVGTENLIIERAKEGDMQAIGTIYERYHTPVYRYLFFRTGDHATAEDLTSEVFLRVLRALPDYQTRHTPFQAWLFQIARFLTIDHYRKNNRFLLEDLPETLAAETERPENLVNQLLNAELLNQALDTLLPDQREVVLLRFLIGMPIHEVAQTLHKTEDAIKGLQRRGLMALRDALKEMEITYD